MTTYGLLHLRLPDGQVQSLPVSHPVSIIGSGSEANILILEPSVSSAHARLTFEAGKVTLEDLGSQSGTSIDGEPLAPDKPRWLERACFIRFGSVDAALGPVNSAPPAWPSKEPPAPASPSHPVAPAPTVVALPREGAAPASSAAPLPKSSAVIAPQSRIPSPPAPTPPPPPPPPAPPPLAPKPLSIKLTPRRSARDFTVTITNRQADNDSPRTVLLAGSDPTEQLTFIIKPQTFKLESNQTKTAAAQVLGKPGPFTITAAADGFTASVKGELIRADVLPIVAGIVMGLLVLGVAVFAALAACPTILRNVCGFVPDNPISAPLSSPTFTATITRTPTATATPPPAAPTIAAVATAGPSATAGLSDTPTIAATPKFEGGLLTFKIRQPNGMVSLLLLPPVGDPITLIANKIDLRVLDYSAAQDLFAVEVYDGFHYTLWLLHSDGTVVRDSISDGWDLIRDADFAEDGSFLALETQSGGQPRYFFYSAAGDRLRETALLTPTFTLTFTRTSTITRTPTITRSPTITFTPSITYTPSLTFTPSNTPLAGDTVGLTDTPQPGTPPTATSIFPFRQTGAAQTQTAAAP